MREVVQQTLISTALSRIRAILSCGTGVSSSREMVRIRAFLFILFCNTYKSQPKPDTLIRYVLIVGVAIGACMTISIVVPELTATFDDLPRRIDTGKVARIGLRLGGIRCEIVRNPFIHIARHIVDTQLVRSFQLYRMAFPAVIQVPTDLAQRVASGVCIAFAFVTAFRCKLPLCFGRHPELHSCGIPASSIMAVSRSTNSWQIFQVTFSTG